MKNVYKFITILLIANSWFTGIKFCGSAGIKNGNIRGKVLDYSSKGLPGVSILLVRNGKPPIIRTTISNSEGNYSFSSTPVGKYSLGYSKLGFKSILIKETNPDVDRATVNQIKTYVESGSSVNIPPVILESLGPYGLAPVTLNLIDRFTSEPIEIANINLGSQSIHNSQIQGEFKFKLEIPPSEKVLEQKKLMISAPGFKTYEDELTIIPKQENSFVILLEPLRANVEGQIDFSAFPRANLESSTVISIPNIPSDLLEPKIDSNGFFSIKVPVSTENNIRKFNVRIQTQGFQAITIPNVIAPLAGATTITQLIRLAAITSPVYGKVLSSKGTPPIPSGLNQAYVKELGISASINSGRYFFQAIPIGMNFSVEILIMNNLGIIETGSLDFQSTLNGQGKFTLPTVITKPIDNPDNNQP